MSGAAYTFPMSFLQKLFGWSKDPQVYALVGKSGTGKSYRAKMVAKKYRIDLIIDDGLLIKGDKIVAGYSAKMEKTFLAAVKVAVFDDKLHRDEAAKQLQRSPAKKILILGTSEKMVNKIAIRLQIPPPHKIIRIEDIATQQEIELASRSRNVEGKHVIPVPSSEVRPNYPQIFYDRIRLLFRTSKAVSLKKEKIMFEKSVVRPEFSKTAAVKISEDKVKQLVFQGVHRYNAVTRIKTITISQEEGTYTISMMIDVPCGMDLTNWIHHLQLSLIKYIEEESGILIETIHVTIDKVIRPVR